VNPWTTFRRGLYGTPTVDHTVPPADIVPGFPADACPEVVFDESAEVEQRAQIRAVTRLVHRTLLTESLKAEGMRNTELVDLCLEVRSALQPSAPGSEVLREAPPAAPLRTAVNGSYRWYAS
jgi:hypothetical protein